MGGKLKILSNNNEYIDEIFKSFKEAGIDTGSFEFCEESIVFILEDKSINRWLFIEFYDNSIDGVNGFFNYIRDDKPYYNGYGSIADVLTDVKNIINNE